MVLGPRPYYWPTLPNGLSFGDSQPLATRSGWLALGCMPFVFATSSKANMITVLTGVSYERLHVFHRWISYAFLVLALLHTFPFIIHNISEGMMVMQFETSIFYWTGIIALLAQGWLTFASMTPLRRISYEFFKISHFIAALIFMLFLFFHCDHTMSSWVYFIGTAAIYLPCWLFSRIRTFFEHGVNCKATISIVANHFTRLSIPVDMQYWKPGQHCFLQILGLGPHALTSHPFTVCSLPPATLEEQPELIFYIQSQGSLTKQLCQYAAKQQTTQIPVLINGPYGGINTKLYSGSDRVLVIAGGSGAGWTLPLIEYFARRTRNETLAQVGIDTKLEPGAASTSDDMTHHELMPLTQQRTSCLRVIFATRDHATREWYCSAVKQLLSAYPTEWLSERLSVRIYYTGEHDASSPSPSTTVDDITTPLKYEPTFSTSSLKSTYINCRDYYDRPDLPSFIAEEAQAAAECGQTLGVFGCGPQSMQNDISTAAARANMDIVRGRSRARGVYMHLEHFGWA